MSTSCLISQLLAPCIASILKEKSTTYFLFSLSKPKKENLIQSCHTDNQFFVRIMCNKSGIPLSNGKNVTYHTEWVFNFQSCRLLWDQQCHSQLL